MPASFRDRISGYAPNTRDTEFAFFPLIYTKNKVAREIGAFVPEMYEMAKTGNLKDQRIFATLQQVWIDAGESKEQFQEKFLKDPQAIQDHFREKNSASYDLIQAAEKAKDSKDSKVSISKEVEESIAKMDPLLEATLKADMALLRDMLFVVIPGNDESKKERTFKHKSSFELALLPFKTPDKPHKSVPEVITHAIKRESSFHRRYGKALPHPVSKLTAGKDYLSELKDKGISIKPEWDCAHTTATMHNGKRHRPLLEDVLHYANSWLALLMTGLAVLTVGAYTPWAMVALGLATYFVHSSGNNFGYFDFAEVTLRELRAFFRSDSRIIERFSIKKAADALMKLSFVVALSAIGAFLTYEAAMSLSLSTAFVNGLPSVVANALPALHMGGAVLLTIASFYASFISCLIPMRKEQGLSVNDNRIMDVTEELLDALPEAKYVSNSVKKDVRMNRIVKATEDLGETLSTLLNQQFHAEDAKKSSEMDVDDAASIEEVHLNPQETPAYMQALIKALPAEKLTEVYADFQKQKAETPKPTMH